MNQLQKIKFPDKLEILFRPMQFKVMYGGRGAGRSWGCARALLLIGAQRCIRVLCAREFQNSISESVLKVLADQVEKLGLQSVYTVQQNGIFGSNGTSFAFEGIKNNPQRIKSYEGVDYCWVEEAAKVTEQSWELLLPTIRKAGSEIWITFNPELESDYTYKRFVLNPDPETTFVVKMNYHDNPWFFTDTTLVKLMEYDRANDWDKYQNIWLGFCRQMLEGVVYAKELRIAQEDGRISRAHWEKDLPVDTFWDLGRRDAGAVWFSQQVMTEIRLLRYIEATGEDIPYFAKEIQRLEYYYGTHYQPHDARHLRQGMPASIEVQTRKLLGSVKVIPKLSIATGINATRMIFHKFHFDERNCAEGLRALRAYKYEIDEGERKEQPEHKWPSHGADALRGLGVTYHNTRNRGGASRVLDALASANERVLARLRGGDGSGGSGRWMGQ